MCDVNGIKLREVKVLPVLYSLRKTMSYHIFLNKHNNLQFFLQSFILWCKFLYFQFTLQCFLFKLLFFIHSLFLCLHMNVHSIILLSFGNHQIFKNVRLWKQFWAMVWNNMRIKCTVIWHERVIALVQRVIAWIKEFSCEDDTCNDNSILYIHWS